MHHLLELSDSEPQGFDSRLGSFLGGVKSCKPCELAHELSDSLDFLVRICLKNPDLRFFEMSFCWFLVVNTVQVHQMEISPGDDGIDRKGILQLGQSSEEEVFDFRRCPILVFILSEEKFIDKKSNDDIVYDFRFGEANGSSG